jgi:hypothetical protein
MMAEEIRRSAVRRTEVQSKDADPADDEISELRASARALRQRAERLEAQIRQA